MYIPVVESLPSSPASLRQGGLRVFISVETSEVLITFRRDHDCYKCQNLPKNLPCAIHFVTQRNVRKAIGRDVQEDGVRVADTVVRARCGA